MGGELSETVTNDETRALHLSAYQDVCDNIRVTDETSFKLLRAVPLAAGLGSGGLAVLERSGLLRDSTELSVIGLATIGLCTTLGLFRWELRNIQKCSWLISRAALLEVELFGPCGAQFLGVSGNTDLEATTLDEIGRSSVLVWPWKWGKTQSVKLIYTAAVLAWVVPIVVAVLSLIARHPNST